MNARQRLLGTAAKVQHGDVGSPRMLPRNPASDDAVLDARLPKPVSRLRRKMAGEIKPGDPDYGPAVQAVHNHIKAGGATQPRE